MLAIVMAVGAAASWGLSAVLVRMGLRDLSTWTGTLISLIAGLIYTALLVGALQFGDLRAVGWRAMLLFGLIGVLNFPVGRFCNYLAMDRLGVARSTPILASAPLFAVILAVLFTGEQVRLATAAGIALILSGLYATVTAPPSSPAAAVPPTAAEERSAARTRVIGVLFGLSAAGAYGGSQVLTRQSVQDLAPPLVGTLLALFWGTIGFALLSVRNLSWGAGNPRRGLLCFAAGGILSATGVILLFQALSRGQVVLVSPVASTNPLFTLFFASILLQGLERITARILLGALAVVSGVVILSVF